MTTTTTNSTLGNANISRSFTSTNTDGTYGNTVDSVSAVSAGLSMPNVSITNVCSTIAAGCGAWRILNTTTNNIMRQGLCQEGGYVDYEACGISPYRLQNDDVFQVFTYAVDATANQSNVIALVSSSRGVEAFGATDVVDSTSTAMTSLVSGLGMGDLLFGNTISNVDIQVETGGACSRISIKRADGGTQWIGFGNYRLPTAGGTSTMTNGDFPMSIPVAQGWALECTVITA
jgi:hypothetical protein